MLIDRERADYSDSEDDPFQFIDGYLATHDAAEFLNAAKSFQWSSRIHFTGYIKHASLRYLLCLSDVAIFPSIVKEAYPLALLEAMAAGAFPIASDYGGLKDGLRQLEGVFDAATVELTHIPMDPESRIEELVERTVRGVTTVDPHTRQVMVAHIKANCSWERVRSMLDDFFEA